MIDSDVVRMWAGDPNRWVSDIFGESFSPNSLQKHAWDVLGEYVRAKMKIRDGEEVTPEERQVTAIPDLQPHSVRK